MKVTKGTNQLGRKAAEIEVRKALLYCRTIHKRDIRESVRVFTDAMMRGGHLVELWHIEAIAGEYRLPKDYAANMLAQFEADHLCFRERNPTPVKDVLQASERKYQQRHLA